MPKAGTFYDYVMAGEAALAAARSVEGFGEEIALLRANLRAEAQLRFGNLPVLIRGAEAVARLVAADARLAAGARNDPYAGAAQALTEIRGALA